MRPLEATLQNDEVRISTYRSHALFLMLLWCKAGCTSGSLCFRMDPCVRVLLLGSLETCASSSHCNGAAMRTCTYFCCVRSERHLAVCLYTWFDPESRRYDSWRNSTDSQVIDGSDSYRQAVQSQVELTEYRELNKIQVIKPLYLSESTSSKRRQPRRCSVESATVA